MNTIIRHIELHKAHPAVASAAIVDWPDCGNFATTLNTARQQYTPLGVLYISSSAGKDDRYKNERLEGHPPYQNMLKVRIKNSSSDTAFLALVHRLGWSPFPMVLICDGRGHVLGVHSDETVIDPSAMKEADNRTIAEQAATAWSIIKWEKSVDDLLKVIDARIKNRQFAEFSALVAQIDAQDKKFTAQLAAVVPWQPADRHDPWFYEKEVKDARERLKTAIKQEFDAAKALFAAGKVKQARDVLDDILFFKADDDLAKQMADLKALVDLPLKLSPKPAPVPAPATSPTSAAPAAAK